MRATENQFAKAKLIARLSMTLLTFACGAVSQAASSLIPTFSLDGRLFTDTNATQPLLDNGNLRIQILSSNQLCILYEETQSFNTRDSDGYFHISVGSVRGDYKRNGTSGLDSNNSMASIYANAGTINGKTLSGFACTFQPLSGEGRYVRVEVITSDGQSRMLSPNLALESVPTAVVAETLQGLDSTKFIQVGSSSHPNLTQTNVETVFDNLTNLTALLAGTSSLYTKAGGTGSVLPSPSTAPSGSTAIAAAEGQVWYDSTSHSIRYSDGSSIQTVGAASGAGLTSIVLGSGLSSTGGTTISTGGQTISVDSGTTAGKIVALDSNAELPAVSGANLTSLDGGAIQSGTIGGTTSISTSGTLLTTSSVTAGTFNIYDNSGAGPGHVAISAPSVTTSYPLKLPAAQGGLNQILKNDGGGNLSWVDFAVSNALSLGNGKIWIGDSGGKAQELALSGDITLSNAGATKVVALQSTAVSSTTPLAGQIYKYDSASSKLIPTFVSLNELRSGISSGAIFPTTMSCGQSKTMTYSSATDSFDCVDIKITASQIDSLTSSLVLNGGQAGTVTLGSTDPNDVVIKSNNAAKLTILSGGNVGIGTTNPGAALDVVGALKVSGALNASYFMDSGGCTILDSTKVGNNCASSSFAIRASNQNVINITSGGNVGIGTTSPNAKLDVNGTISTTSLNAGGITSNGTIFAQAWHADTYASSSTTLNFPESGYTQATITNSNLAAGKQAMLQISPGNGSGNAQRAYIGAFSVAGATAYTPVIVIGQQTDATAYAERLRIDTSGNVGIGTTSPNSALQVNGYIQLALTTGAPPSADCDAADERGRMKVDSSSGTLYVCVNSGWVAK